jgi:HK97 family phage portal protein
MSALQNAAVWACQRVLKATISGLPVDVYRVARGRKTEVSPQPGVIANPHPSASVRRRGWVGQVIGSMLMDGNIYADVIGMDSMGRPLKLNPVNPDQVTWAMSKGQLVPFVTGKERAVWPNGDLWHVPASQLMIPGQPFALSPTEMGRTSIGTGIAAEEFGAKFFGDGAHPSGVLSGESDPTPDQAEAIKRRFVEITQGSREPLVMGSGWTYTKMSVDPKDGQFIDLLRFEVEQACRWYGVPPSMVYSSLAGSAVTYQNLNDSDLMFLKYSVNQWLLDLEDAWSECIAAPQIVKLNPSALLRMDDTKRWDLWRTRLELKSISVNQVLHIEDEEPFADPEFDKPGIPGGIEKPALPAKVTPPPADGTGTAS